jgi:hypothetical protein
MRISIVPWMAVAAVAAATLTQAQSNEASLTVTGLVVSTGNTSMVVKIDDGGHPIPFVIGTTTVLPSGLTAGSRVSVRYHPLGSTGQMADEVTLLQGPPVAALGQKAPATQRREPRQGDDVPQSPAPAQPAAGTPSRLPATASPFPVLFLVGLGALLGSLSLRVAARRRV